MANAFAGSRRGSRVAVTLTMLAGLALATPAGAEPSGADIQWAQTILKEKGFLNARPNSRMTPETKQALSAYQKSVGLKQTGELDAATVNKMMEGRQAQIPSTMRTLGAPDPNRPKVNPNAPEPKPLAAPVTGVQSAGGEGDNIVGTVRRAGAPAAGEHPVPSAAPRVGVAADTSTPAPMPGQVTMPEEEPFRLTAPQWVRFGIIGFIVSAFGFVGWWWWGSGRRPEPTERPMTTRREPSLSSGERTGGRQAPTLSPRGSGASRRY